MLMLRGTYIGPLKQLKGKTALIRQDTNTSSNYEAQFDDLGLPSKYTNGWTSFKKSEWTMIERKEETQ